MLSVSGLMNTQPGSSVLVTWWLALSKTMPTNPGSIVRHVENRMTSAPIATSAMISSVPRRATERDGMGLAARAIGVLLLSILIRFILIGVRRRLVGGFIEIVLEAANPAHDRGCDGEADLPCDDD